MLLILLYIKVYILSCIYTELMYNYVVDLVLREMFGGIDYARKCCYAMY